MRRAYAFFFFEELVTDGYRAQGVILPGAVKLGGLLVGCGFTRAKKSQIIVVERLPSEARRNSPIIIYTYSDYDAFKACWDIFKAKGT